VNEVGKGGRQREGNVSAFGQIESGRAGEEKKRNALMMD
jgi:hypothetical protein